MRKAAHSAPDATSLRVSHPFKTAPHRTLIGLAFPVLLSLIAEPLTGLVDTAFISRLGVDALAALGVGTTLLSSLFWIFNFLNIGTQTRVAQHHGADRLDQAGRINCMALGLAVFWGLLLMLPGDSIISEAASRMGADEDVLSKSVQYIQIRLWGAPAVLVSLAAFGTLRGLQDMRTPLMVSVAVNVLNIILDALLIFGWGPVPALGIAGAAWASTASQWIGAVWVAAVTLARLGLSRAFDLHQVWDLVCIGGNLFVRTGALTLFLVLTTRAATLAGPASGAAHQAIRQMWVFSALLMDAYAVAGQSLIGYFVGNDQMRQTRRVALYVCGWSAGTGLLLALAMWKAEPWVVAVMVPAGAAGHFHSAWLIAAVGQPINALSFATDGIHWGTGDFAYLRNAMLTATGCGIAALFLLNKSDPNALTGIWLVVSAWILLRAGFGLVRIWPGSDKGPLGKSRQGFA
jgi:MATE family multidrug resistance protein